MSWGSFEKNDGYAYSRNTKNKLFRQVLLLEMVIELVFV